MGATTVGSFTHRQAWWNLPDPRLAARRPAQAPEVPPHLGTAQPPCPPGWWAQECRGNVLCGQQSPSSKRCFHLQLRAGHGVTSGPRTAAPVLGLVLTHLLWKPVLKYPYGLYTLTRADTHMHTQAQTHMRTHKCTHMHTGAHMDARTHTRMHTRTYTHAHTAASTQASTNPLPAVATAATPKIKKK